MNNYTQASLLTLTPAYLRVTVCSYEGVQRYFLTFKQIVQNLSQAAGHWTPRQVQGDSWIRTSSTLRIRHIHGKGKTNAIEWEQNSQLHFHGNWIFSWERQCFKMRVPFVFLFLFSFFFFDVYWLNLLVRLNETDVFWALRDAFSGWSKVDHSIIGTCHQLWVAYCPKRQRKRMHCTCLWCWALIMDFSINLGLGKTVS